MKSHFPSQRTKIQIPDNSHSLAHECGRNIAITLAKNSKAPHNKHRGSKTFDGNWKRIQGFLETPVSLRTHPVIQIVLALHQGHVCIWIVPVAHLRSSRQLLLWNLKVLFARTHYCPIHGLSVMFSALPNQLNNYQLNMNKTSDANAVTNKGLWSHSISCTSLPFLLCSPFCTIFRIACLILAYPEQANPSSWVKTVILSNDLQKMFPCHF